jgi:parvulin-like peptidyl-prolyl isomerase
MPEGYRGINHILLKVDDALLNTWKDLTARYEEQKAAEEAPEETIKPVDAEPETDNETEEPAGTPEPTAEPVTEEMIEAAKQAILDSVQPTVDEIKAKLKDGVSFDELILEYGNDPGMQDEKTRASGYPVHKDSIIWDPAFTAGAVALEKIGDVSEPVVGQYGVHILHYLRDIPGGAIELTDDMKNEIHDELLEQKRNAALNTAIDKWLEESDIVYTEAGEAWKVPEETAEAAAPEAEESAEETPAPAD